MNNYTYQDILIENGDVVLDAGRQPLVIQNRAVIAQDLKHALIESGLAIRLIGETSSDCRRDVIKQIELLAENEPRLIAGTVSISSADDLGQIWLTAITREFGEIKLDISNG